MTYPNEIFFLIATLILWGMVIASNPLANHGNTFQPKNYWFLAIAFTATAFTFFAIASAVNLALLTFANTCIVAGNLYMALFCRFLRRPEVKTFKLLPLFALFIFGLVFEYLRQR